MSLIQPCLVRINYGSFWICFSYFTNSSEISFSPRDYLWPFWNYPLSPPLLGEIFSRYKLWMILLMTPTSKLSSFPNRTFALRVFPLSITFPAETIFLTEFLPTPVAAAVFAITAPALNCGLFPFLLSSWKYFATFSIICCSSTQIDFPLFAWNTLEVVKWCQPIFQSTQKASLLGLGPHFIIDDITYQINSSVYVANGGDYYARLIKIHIHLIAFDRIAYREIQLIALTLMTSSKARAPELRMVTRDCYWNDKAPFS